MQPFYSELTVAKLLQALLCILLLAVPTACSLTPVYATRDNTALPAIAVEPIKDRVGQMLSNELENVLGPATAPKYRLRVTLAESIDDFGIRRDLTATFARLTVTANFELWPAVTGASDTRPLLTGKVRAINSYNILANTFATLTAEEDARAKASQQLARDIQLRLAAYLNP